MISVSMPRQNLVKISDIVVANMSSPVSFGVVAVFDTSDAAIINSTFTNNLADEGGAIYMYGIATATLDGSVFMVR